MPGSVSLEETLANFKEKYGEEYDIERIYHPLIASNACPQELYVALLCYFHVEALLMFTAPSHVLILSKGVYIWSDVFTDLNPDPKESLRDIVRKRYGKGSKPLVTPGAELVTVAIKVVNEDLDDFSVPPVYIDLTA